jgi:hypothetical protein
MSVMVVFLSVRVDPRVADRTVVRFIPAEWNSGMVSLSLLRSFDPMLG